MTYGHVAHELPAYHLNDDRSTVPACSFVVHLEEEILFSLCSRPNRPGQRLPSLLANVFHAGAGTNPAAMMPGQANGGQDLDFSLRAQREMYQSLGMGMAPGSAQGGADSSRLGGLGGGMQPRPAGALGALGMSVNVPSFAAALDEHSQRIQAQAASTMANMLQQDQAALYQQSQAAAQRQPQAQQPLAGMTQQQFTQQLSHTYTQQLAAQQQQVAQQFAAQQAAAVKAQQQVMMRANQAMAAAKKPALPTAANVTPRNVGGQSAQQAAAQAAAARRPFPISSRDLKVSRMSQLSGPPDLAEPKSSIVLFLEFILRASLSPCNAPLPAAHLSPHFLFLRRVSWRHTGRSWGR